MMPNHRLPGLRSAALSAIFSCSPSTFLPRTTCPREQAKIASDVNGILEKTAAPSAVVAVVKLGQPKTAYRRVSSLTTATTALGAAVFSRMPFTSEAILACSAGAGCSWAGRWRGEERKIARERGATQARQTMVWHHGMFIPHRIERKSQVQAAAVARACPAISVRVWIRYGWLRATGTWLLLNFSMLHWCRTVRSAENDADVSVAMIADLAVVTRTGCVGFVVSESGLLEREDFPFKSIAVTCPLCKEQRL